MPLQSLDVIESITYTLVYEMLTNRIFEQNSHSECSTDLYRYSLRVVPFVGLQDIYQRRRKKLGVISNYFLFNGQNLRVKNLTIMMINIIFVSLLGLRTAIKVKCQSVFLILDGTGRLFLGILTMLQHLPRCIKRCRTGVVSIPVWQWSREQGMFCPLLICTCISSHRII